MRSYDAQEGPDVRSGLGSSHSPSEGAALYAMNEENVGTYKAGIGEIIT